MDICRYHAKVHFSVCVWDYIHIVHISTYVSVMSMCICASLYQCLCVCCGVCVCRSLCIRAKPVQLASVVAEAKAAVSDTHIHTHTVDRIPILYACNYQPLLHWLQRWSIHAWFKPFTTCTLHFPPHTLGIKPLHFISYGCNRPQNVIIH